MSLEAAHNFQLLQSLSSFQRQGLFCDTVIQTKESAISAHSVILSSFSPLLASLLNQQPMNDNNSNLIDLSVYDTELIQELVDFFYTGNIQLLRLDELEELCKVLDVRLVLESIFSAAMPPKVDVIKIESQILDEHSETRSPASLNSACSGDGYFQEDSRTIPDKVYKQENVTFTGTSVELDLLSDYNECKESRKMSEAEELSQDNSDAIETSDIGDDNPPESKTRGYCCNVCGSNFSSKTKRSRHWFNHFLTEDGEAYVCNQCPKVISLDNKKGLRDHLGRHDVSSLKKVHICTWCGLKFRAPRLLKDHMNLHTGSKPHQCKVCDRTFASSQSLSLHTRYHTNEKRYLCTFCGKDFFRHNSYSSHLKVHTGVKPYQCKECNYRCSQSGTLKVHMRMHTSEKPFRCTLCTLSFVSNSRLKLHKRQTHMSNDEKPFHCNLCGKGFAFNYILETHMKSHFKPNRCGTCGRRFALKYKMELHLTTCKGPKIQDGASSKYLKS